MDTKYKILHFDDWWMQKFLIELTEQSYIHPVFCINITLKLTITCMFEVLKNIYPLVNKDKLKIKAFYF